MTNPQISRSQMGKIPNEGDFVVMKYDYTHTKKKGQLAKITGLHLRDVSVEFADGTCGSYSWYDVEIAEEGSHCQCPHCEAIISPVWCHMGQYYECNSCHMAFKDEDIKWCKFGKLD